MGGQAFKESTRRISQTEIPETLRWLGDRLKAQGLTPKYLHENLLGSGGKKDTSGDLDINVNDKRFDLEEIARVLTRVLGTDAVKSRPGTKQIFTAVPIAGTDGKVQVDFMFGDIEWQRFSYWSSEHSAFKGLYRTELIKALCAFKSDWVLEEDGNMVARVGPTFFHDRGIVWRYRHRPMRQDGTGRIKELKELSRAEFLEIYPTATPASHDVLTDPVRVMKHILPRSPYSAHDSFETLWVEIVCEYDKAERAVIRDIYLERLNSLKAELPKEIHDALERDCK